MTTRLKLSLASAALTLGLVALPVGQASAANYSVACPTWACGSVTVNAWNYNYDHWEIPVTIVVGDTKKDGRLAYAKVRYYTSRTCGYQDGSAYSAPSDGTGATKTYNGTRSQNFLYGLRVILRDQSTTGGSTAYGNYVQNPKAEYKVTCAP